MNKTYIGLNKYVTCKNKSEYTELKVLVGESLLKACLVCTGPEYPAQKKKGKKEKEKRRKKKREKKSAYQA